LRILSCGYFFLMASIGTGVSYSGIRVSNT
jgi:hypothetical protein